VDLGRVDLTQGPAKDPEVVCEDEHLPPEYGTPPGDYAVGQRPLAVEPEAPAPMAGEKIELNESSRVEQHVEPLAGRQLAAGMLAFGRHLIDALPGVTLQ
jgi:hypothetical protein